jgi:hypothetical protein
MTLRARALRAAHLTIAEGAAISHGEPARLRLPDVARAALDRYQALPGFGHPVAGPAP